MLQYIEKYHLFPIDLSENSREKLSLLCENGTGELKLEISKELYLFLGKMMFSFEESNIIKMEPYIKLLELNRTEFPYEQANNWGSDIEITNMFDKELFFFMFNRKNTGLASKEDYQAYHDELRKVPIDISAYFNDEQKLPSSVYIEVEKVLKERYKKCNDYIDEHYPLIKRAFSTYHKDVRVYLQSRYGNAYLVMINFYEGVDSGITIFAEWLYRLHKAYLA